jgi:hypothetical protein
MSKAREVLAAIAHSQWSGWMKYLFSKMENGTIPRWAMERWSRQMNTEYKCLPEIEKESDRVEADKYLAEVAPLVEALHQLCDAVCEENCYGCKNAYLCKAKKARAALEEWEGREV